MAGRVNLSSCDTSSECVNNRAWKISMIFLLSKPLIIWKFARKISAISAIFLNLLIFCNFCVFGVFRFVHGFRSFFAFTHYSRLPSFSSVLLFSPIFPHFLKQDSVCVFHIFCFLLSFFVFRIFFVNSAYFCVFWYFRQISHFPHFCCLSVNSASFPQFSIFFRFSEFSAIVRLAILFCENEQFIRSFIEWFFFTKRNVFLWFYRYFLPRIQWYDHRIPALFLNRFLLMWCLMQLINVWLVNDELELILKWKENFR